ncbi:MAG TPA: Xaa-Pro peptidase family protein [Bryobacteraceae bacterium]|jgi:Xaa-Pro aminopeptidase|nr:Xaa-Pro peptidase family protein [Bryobacteraceae bacterium]
MVPGERVAVINEHRRRQLLELMGERGWDSILLYGNAWRKDPFRSLVNFNFSGDHALARLSRSGEIAVTFSDPWDAETASASLQPDFAKAFAGGASPGITAIAGLEFMEERFVAACGTLPISATADVEELRRVKTAEEIGYIRQACDLADRGYQRFVEVAEPGMREFELVAEVEAFLKANGAEDNFMLIASGGTEVVGMKPPTDRKFQQGDSVTTELTPQVNGYYAQICRTLVLGEPSPDQLKAFDIFSEAQSAAQDLIKPGITAADAARAQNDVFRKYGYGDYTGAKYTRVRGHCVGLYPDETPHILEDVDYMLKQDMVVIAHPNTYLPLSGYMVFGDTLLVTETGNTRLNKTEKKLFKK